MSTQENTTTAAADETTKTSKAQRIKPLMVKGAEQASAGFIIGFFAILGVAAGQKVIIATTAAIRNRRNKEE